VNAYAWGIVVSIAVYVVIGNYAGRKVRHLDDYFVAGRQAPTLMIIGTLVASLLSTNAFLGEVGMAYSGYGTLFLTLVAVNVAGYVGGALYFGRHLRRSRALTVAEYFGQRFASHRVQVVAGITVIIGLGAYLVAVTQGAALILTQMSPLPYGVALFIVWIGYTGFTLYSGSRGVIITDTVMFLLFTLVALVALAFVVASAGGWFATIEALAVLPSKPGIIAWHGATGPGATWETHADGLAWALILGVAWAVVIAVSPWQASRYLMARDEHTVIRAACGAGGALLLLYPVLMLCGAAINLGNPGIEPAESAILWAAQHLMPTSAGVLLVAGIMAAALSSATTFLSLVGFSASNDILTRARTDDRARLRVSRLSMVALGLVALALAAALPTRIVWITYFAATVFASSWGPVAVMSVWSRRITADGAFWGMIVGLVGNVVPKALALAGVIRLPVWADPIIIGAVLGTVTIVLVSRLGTVTEAERRYREWLHQVPADELDADELRRTQLWPSLLIAGGIVLATLMMVFYALPYDAAVRRDRHGFVSGEAWLSLGCGFVLIASGLVARWTLRTLAARNPTRAVQTPTP
jgi:sodium/pantothenate symporter